MAERRRVIGEKRSLRVAVPPIIAAQLGLLRGSEVWWHLPWSGEATLTATPDRARGYPDAAPLLRELATARAEIARLQRRNESRWRVRYAEGYALGYQRALMRLTPPATPGTAREDARRRAFDALGARRVPRAPRRGRDPQASRELVGALQERGAPRSNSEGPPSP